MTGVVEGFVTIGLVIGLGFVLAHLKVLDLGVQRMLAHLSFFVASPALLVVVLADTDVSQVLSAGLVANASSVALVATASFVLGVMVFGQRCADAVISGLCASYVNAGNLGLPIAAYVLGDAALVAPALLIQLVVLQPLALTVLDASAAERRLRWWEVALRPVRNPLTVGTLIGLALSASDTTLPFLIDEPLTLVGNMAVPSMLIAYGISLRLGGKPGSGGSPAQIGTLVLFKQVIQPLIAYGVARFAFGLEGIDLLAVTVIAALPTAQNVFVIATRYGRSPVLARDAIFVSTFLSVPTIAVATALIT